MLRFASMVLVLNLAGTVSPPRRAVTKAAAVPRRTVAILEFDNHTGNAEYDALGKGIASMMISDLSVVKEIQLLERERVRDLIQEVDRQQTKYFDASTAVRVGRMVGAQYIVTGAFAALRPNMRIDTRVVRVETGEIVKTAQVTGDQDRFFELEQALAAKLIDGLGLTLSAAERRRLAAQQKGNRVNALETMEHLGFALDSYDKGDFNAALSHMRTVVNGAPRSKFIRAMQARIQARAAGGATPPHP